MENITNEDIWLGGQTQTANLLGNKGVQWSATKLSGVEILWSAGADKERYSLFNPGAKNTIGINFTSRNEESEETIFSFSFNMLRFVKKTPTRFSIGIRDMRITQ
jgi:hypothetical protein